MKKHFITFIVALCLVYGGFISVFPYMIEKLERQAAAENDRLCASYGEDMNQYYKKDVCEEQSQYKPRQQAQTLQ